MNQKAIILLAIFLVTGCATSTKQAINGDIDIVGQKLQNQRAEIYLAHLSKKKQIFMQKLHAEENAASLIESEPQVAIDCNAMATGDWASSVRFGQAFLPYANHVATVARCYSNGQRS